MRKGIGIGGLETERREDSRRRWGKGGEKECCRVGGRGGAYFSSFPCLWKRVCVS